MTSRHHTVLATLLILGGLYVMRLTTVEIQPYPEGLYALRGLSIQHTMQWMDQASVAPGGMYSAMMPPLPAWMIAIGIDVVGPTPLAVRWFAVCTAMLTMLLTYLLARRVVSFESSVMALVIIGTSVPLIVSGRLADTMVPFVASALAMIWAVASLPDAESFAGRFARCVLLAVATAAGLLSAPVAMVPVVLGVTVLLRTSRQRGITAIGIVAGLILGLPWWLMMASRYGEQVLLAWSLPHPTLATSSGGVLSPVMFLLLASPILSVAIVWIIVVLRDRSLLISRDRPEMAALGLWFVVAMLGMAFSQHRYLASAVVVIPPASILAVAALENVRRESRPRLLLLTYGLIVLAALWFAAAQLISVHLPLQTLLLGVAVAMVAVVLLLTQFRKRAQRQNAAVRLYRPVIYGAIALAAIVALVNVVRPSPSAVIGGRQVARLMIEDTLFHRSFAYVFHNTSETDAVNAQLEWYTQGWMSGTKPGFTHMSIALPADARDEAALAIARLLPWVVYYHPRDRRTLLMDVTQSLTKTHSVAYESDHYTLYKIR